jgi:hypothetical protein
VKKTRLRTFDMLAYTGVAFGRAWTESLVIALDGIAGLDPDGLPMLVDHGRMPGPAGVASTLSREDDGIHLAGRLLDTPEGKHVASLADQKFPWRASIGIRALEERQLGKGETLEVNGTKYTGPDVYVWTKSKLYETSFITAGPADEATAVEVLTLEGDAQERGRRDRVRLAASFAFGARKAKPARLSSIGEMLLRYERLRGTSR